MHDITHRAVVLNIDQSRAMNPEALATVDSQIYRVSVYIVD